MPVELKGATSGSITLAAPAVAGSNTLTLPAATDTITTNAATQTLTNKTLTSPTITGASVSSMASSVLTSMTAQTTTSGTAFDFTSIPSWVKRITVMFNGIGLSGTDHYLVQIGTGGTPTTSGYLATTELIAASSGNPVSSTAGLIVGSGATAGPVSGHMIITNISGNAWVSSHSIKFSTLGGRFGGGDVTLSGTLDNLRITRTGTNTFNSGSVNVLYE